MSGQLTVNDSSLPHRSRNQSGRREGSLRDPHLHPILSRGAGVRSGRSFSSGESQKVRPVSVLATLLEPFAGPGSAEVASHLLLRFGTLDRMLAATDAQIIAACEGVPAVGEMIAGARALVLAALHETVTRSPVNSADPAFKRYLALKFKGRPHEELHAIFVDQNHGFIAEELVSIGDAGRVDARICSILRRAIELGSSALYLVHNHPSKTPSPSPEDVRSTKQISAVAEALDIQVIDHLIIAGSSMVSMRELKLL